MVILSFFVVFLSFSARYPAVHLGFRLGRGLRPMEKAKYESAFEQAQRCFILVFFRTAHCLREKKVRQRRTGYILITKSPYCSITRSGWHLPSLGLP